MTVKCRDWTRPATKTGGREERLNVLEGLTVLWWVTPIINRELPITIFHHELPLTVRFFEVNVIWAFPQVLARQWENKMKDGVARACRCRPCLSSVAASRLNALSEQVCFLCAKKMSNPAVKLLLQYIWSLLFSALRSYDQWLNALIFI